MNFKSLKDHIYDYLSLQITEGKLKANMKINEIEICEELGVSRTPLKEALIQLEYDGLLKRLPRKGFKVKALTPEIAKEKYTIIGALDGLAAVLSLPNLSKSDYFEMDMTVKKIDLVLEEEDFNQYIELQNNFHNVYVNKCGNKELIKLLNKQKKSFLKKTYFEEMKQNKIVDVLIITNNEHKKIIELMKEGKKEKIEDYIRNEHWNPEYSLYQLYE